jgi:hypothetical protein
MTEPVVAWVVEVFTMVAALNVPELGHWGGGMISKSSRNLEGQRMQTETEEMGRAA